LAVFAQGGLDRVNKSQGVLVAGVQAFSEDAAPVQHPLWYFQNTREVRRQGSFRLIQLKTEIRDAERHEMALAAPGTAGAARKTAPARSVGAKTP
jgi:hypothetical protein